MNPSPKRFARAAFSLIEVNMAILIIAIGMLGLMSLFPLGLRQSSLAFADMNQAAAADYILGRIEANSMTVTDWNHWDNPGTMRSRLSEALGSEDVDLAFVGATQERTLQGFPGPDDSLRYRLELIQFPERFRYGIQLRTSERESGNLDRNPVYYTEVFFRGRPSEN